MATDFTNNNTTINTSGGFKPTTKNTPLDVRTRVNTKADIDSIPNPFVGMKIIVLQDETNGQQMTEYVVTSLKANSLGVADTKVNEVVLTKDFLGVSSGSGMTSEQVQQLNTAYTHSQTPHVQQSDIPTKTSQLQNDTSYVTEDYVNDYTGGKKQRYITQAEYNALPDADKNDQTIVWNIIDAEQEVESNIQDLELTNDVLYLVDKDGNKIGDGVTISIEANNESLAGYIESVPGNNLVIGTNAISFNDNTGATISGTFTNYIPMKKGQYYISNLSHTQYYFFDIDKNHVGTTTFVTNPQRFVPSVNGYLLIKIIKHENPIVLEGTDIDTCKEDTLKIQKDKVQPISKWYGKKWLCIGDSITTDTKQYADVGYAKLISRELGMILTNVSVSGKTVSYFYDDMNGYPNDFDLITVMLGANNHGYNCAIGALNDDDYKNGTYDSGSSFYAQTQLLYEKLRAKYPKSVIMFIGLIKRWAPTETSNNKDGYMINAQGNTTQAFCEALQKVCNWYSIPYVDVYNTIDPRSLINRQTFFCGETDGTHPNDIGHALFIAPVIRDAIIKHEPYFFNDWSTVIQYGKIQVDTSTLSLNEGASGTINVTLDKAPTYDQTVNITSDNTDVTISPSSLTFTSDNFGTPQVITITVAEDGDEYADETANVILSSSGVSNVIVSVSITDNDEEPTTDPDEPTPDPDEPTPDPDEPQTANLIHKWLHIDTAVEDDQYGYPTLHDQVGGIDLTSPKFWTNNTNAGDGYVVEEYRVKQKFGDDLWDMPDGMSFSIKINRYTRLGMYFAALTMFHTGSINGMNIITDGWSGYNGTNVGRFNMSITSTASAVFGDGVICISYLSTSGEVKLKGDPAIKMVKKDDTVDILLTFDAETNTVKLYQDGTKILTSVLDIPLRIDGIINWMGNASDQTYESIEIYDGVLSVESEDPVTPVSYTNYIYNEDTFTNPAQGTTPSATTYYYMNANDTGHEVIEPGVLKISNKTEGKNAGLMVRHGKGDNQIYYIQFKVKSEAAILAGSPQKTIVKSDGPLEDWTMVSFIYTDTSATMHSIKLALNNNGVIPGVAYIKELMRINLTEIYGAGNEPSDVPACDELFATFVPGLRG